MKTRFPINLILVFALAGAGFAQPPAWTLQRCLDEALRAAPRLEASRQTATAAEAAWKESAATRWPSVGLNSSYSYTSRTQKVDFPTFAPGLPAMKLDFGDGNVYEMAAVAKVPLYAGGGLVEKARADASGFRAAWFDVAADSLKLLYDVRRAYFNALGAAARADAAHKSVKRLQRHLDDVAGQKKIGTASDEQRVAAESRLRQAEGQALLADAEAQAARLALGNLVSQPGFEIHPEGDLENSIDVPDSTALTYGARVEVQSASARIEQGYHLTKAARGAWLPSLSGTAAYHYAKPGVDMVKNKWMDYYTAGLSASWTLWDFQARSARVQQTTSSVRAAEARKTDLQNALQTREQTARDAREAARLADDKTAQRAALERQRSTMVEARYHNGLATESEYLDAQDDLTTAELDRVGAVVRLRLAEADLIYAAGY
jgi:outer membrane protein